MDFCKSAEYIKDVDIALDGVAGLDNFRNKSVCVTGATGLIGSFIVDMLVRLNETTKANITIYAVGRSMRRLKERFGEAEKPGFIALEHNVCEALDENFVFHYIIHAAGNASPKAIMQDPVGTIMTNINGTMQLLKYGRRHGMERFLYVSSGEVYGEVDGNDAGYREEVNGYIDTISVRSCYPVSKRAAENLCISCTKQYGVNVVIVRPGHIYGPNTIKSDNRAPVQFAENVLRGSDIVLKSLGNQLRSYTYVADCASAILHILLHGLNGEVYNISNKDSVVSIAEFAQIMAEAESKKVIFGEFGKLEKGQNAPFRKQILCSDKLEQSGWKGRFGITEGIQSMLTVLKELKER